MSRASTNTGGQSNTSATTSGSRQAGRNSKSDPPSLKRTWSSTLPFIYRANEPVNLTENVAHLKMESKPMSFEPVVLPPPAKSAKNAKPAKPQASTGSDKPAKQKSGFFSKVGAFFASIFHYRDARRSLHVTDSTMARLSGSP